MSIFTPPSTDSDWNDLIVVEGLHVKWHNEPERPDKYPSSQLQAMRDSHAAKVVRLLPEKDQAASLLAALDQLPAESVTSILESGAMGEVDSAEDYIAEKNAAIDKYWRVDRVVQLIDKEIEFREAGTYPRSPVGTTYYIDADNGNDANDGLGTGSGNAWATFSKFVASARSAGDIAIARRGTTANYGTGTASVTSDGNPASPITLEADFDDVWGDFANSSQTYTPVLGSKTMEASATITGISAGDWIYNSTDGDDPRLFAYEVASVSGTTLTLHLPFKGSAGATKTLKIMPANPVLGAGGSADALSLSADTWWTFQGIEVYGDATSGQFVNNSSVRGIEIRDCIAHGGDASCDGLTFQANAYVKVYKTRIYDYTQNGIDCAQNANDCFVQDCLIDGGTGGGTNRRGISAINYGGDLQVEDTEIKDNSYSDVAATNTSARTKFHFRNCLFSSTIEIRYDADSTCDPVFIYSEDHNQTKGDNRVYSTFSSASDTPITQSETTTVRAGGSATSVKVTPGTYVGTQATAQLALLGVTSQFKDGYIPIYADTASRTYTFYFKTGATTDWTANPTADELFIEARYWGHASNVQRIPIRSTGTVSFTTSTDWQSIALTVQPAQTGLVYIRVVYGKAKESGKSNVFYFDPIPVIS